jgi:hypothetical protein
MCAESIIGGSDLEELARRFIAETCDFLSANWDVEGIGWPRRKGGGCEGPSVAPPDLHRPVFKAAPLDEESQRPVVVRTAHELVHRLVPLVGAEEESRLVAEMGGADNHLFVVVPAAAVQVDMYIHCLPCYPVRTWMAGDEDEDWPIWVPEVAGPNDERYEGMHGLGRRHGKKADRQVTVRSSRSLRVDE